MWVNALSIVLDPQAKLAWVVADFHFDPRRVRVSKGIAQRLGGNPVDFVADERNEIPWCAFDLYPKLGTLRAGLIGSESFSELADRRGKVVGDHRRRAQGLHRIPALGKRLPGLLDDSLQRLLGFRAIEEHVRDRVKLHQHAL